MQVILRRSASPNKECAYSARALRERQTYFKNLLEERTNLVSTQSYKDAIELQSHRAKVADIISGILLSSGFVTGIAASFVGRNRKKDVGDS